MFPSIPSCSPVVYHMFMCSLYNMSYVPSFTYLSQSPVFFRPLVSNLVFCVYLLRSCVPSCSLNSFSSPVFSHIPSHSLIRFLSCSRRLSCVSPDILIFPVSFHIPLCPPLPVFPCVPCSLLYTLMFHRSPSSLHMFALRLFTFSCSL